MTYMNSSSKLLFTLLLLWVYIISFYLIYFLGNFDQDLSFILFFLTISSKHFLRSLFQMHVWGLEDFISNSFCHPKWKRKKFQKEFLVSSLPHLIPFNRFWSMLVVWINLFLYYFSLPFFAWKSIIWWYWRIYYDFNIRINLHCCSYSSRPCLISTINLFFHSTCIDTRFCGASGSWLNNSCGFSFCTRSALLIWTQSLSFLKSERADQFLFPKLYLTYWYLTFVSFA